MMPGCLGAQSGDDVVTRYTEQGKQREIVHGRNETISVLVSLMISPFSSRVSQDRPKVTPRLGSEYELRAGRHWIWARLAGLLRPLLA